MAPSSTNDISFLDHIFKSLPTSTIIGYIILIVIALLLFGVVIYILNGVVNAVFDCYYKTQRIANTKARAISPIVHQRSLPLPTVAASSRKAAKVKKGGEPWSTWITSRVTAYKNARQARKEETEKWRKLSEENAAYASVASRDWAFRHLQAHRGTQDYMVPVPFSTPLPTMPTSALVSNGHHRKTVEHSTQYHCRPPHVSHATQSHSASRGRCPLPVPPVGIGLGYSVPTIRTPVINAYTPHIRFMHDIAHTPSDTSCSSFSTPDLATPSTGSYSMLSYFQTPPASEITVFIPADLKPTIPIGPSPKIDKFGPFRVVSPRDSVDFSPMANQFVEHV